MPAGQVTPHANVLGLDVAVHHALGMGKGQGLSHFADDLLRIGKGQRALAVQQSGEVIALHILKRQVKVTILVHTRVQQLRRTGVAHLQRQRGFALKTLAQLRVVRQMGWQKLERNLLAHPQLLGQVHRPHAATADLAQQLVTPRDHLQGGAGGGMG